MDRITRKQRQLERKYDNIRRIAAQEERYTVASKDTLSLNRTTRTTSLSPKGETGESGGGSSEASRGGAGMAATHSGNVHTGSEQDLLRAPAATVEARSVSADPIKRYHQQDQQTDQSGGADQQSPMRSLQVFIAIQDYVPEPGQAPEEALCLEQGQIVEVLDNQNPANWLVRTKAKPPQTGWVPGSYFETPTKYYAQRKSTRELAGKEQNLTEQQQALLKREQVFLDLLRTEEEFVAELRNALDHYVKAFDSPEAPEEVRGRRQEMALNLHEICDFHTNIMLKGLQYHSDDSGTVGQTFVRLERDFEKHVEFMRELGNVQKMVQDSGTVFTFLEDLQASADPAIKEYSHYLELVPNRFSQYEEFLKEIIKYSVRAQQNTNVMQKALELVQSVPKRAQEMELIKNLINFPGEVQQLGRIYRHELFNVWEDEQQEQSEKYIFLFRNKMVLTDRDTKPEPPLFRHYSTIMVDKYSIRSHTSDEDTIVLHPNEPGLPIFLIKAKDPQSQEFVRKAWLRDIGEMQAEIGGLEM